MTIEEITEKIIESRNNDIAKAFTLHICGLLLNNGIVPIMTEYTENDVENIEDADEYKIVMEYGVAFKKLDCTEHDKKVYNKALDDFAGGLDYLLVKYAIENTLEPSINNVNFSLSHIEKIISRVFEQLKAGDSNGT